MRYCCSCCAGACCWAKEFLFGIELREADGPGGLLVVLVVEGGGAGDFLVDGADAA
jgi:hypothetical protein